MKVYEKNGVKFCYVDMGMKYRLKFSDNGVWRGTLKEVWPDDMKDVINHCIAGKKDSPYLVKEGE